MGKIKELFSELWKVKELQMELNTLIPSIQARKDFVKKLDRVSKNVECPHNMSHTLSFIVDLFKLPDDVEGCVVEAGSYKGGSTAKISLASKMTNRPLVVFDSFEGLPENDEDHDKSIFGYSIKGWFGDGKFCGSLDEVKNNVNKYGEIKQCSFIKGWFEDSMSTFHSKICAAYLDVDLASSTKTCLKYLYPRLVPGGFLYSQDGDFPLVIDVFDDAKFWENEVGCRKPFIEGLRESKMIKIVKASEGR